MDQEEIKDLFEEKYERTLDISYDEWLAKGPHSEDQAYARCIEIDRELNANYDEWFNSTGDKRERLQELRDKLKTEYDLIEEIYHLEANDRNW